MGRDKKARMIKESKLQKLISSTRGPRKKQMENDSQQQDVVQEIMSKLQLKKKITKQQALEMNYLLTQILNFPSEQQAQNHRIANRLGRFDIEKPNRRNRTYCKCCGYIRQYEPIPICTSFDSFPVVGVSTFLFFETIKNLIFLLILITFFHGIYAFITNLYCADLFTASPDVKFNIDNMISWISLDSKIQASIDDQTGRYSKLYLIQMWIGVGLIFFWSLFLYLIRYYQRKKQAIIDKSTISAADFSIVIQNYPKNLSLYDLQLKFNEYAQKLNIEKEFFHIQKINLNSDSNLQKQQEEQMKALNQNYEDMLDFFADWVCQFQENKGFPYKMQQRVQIYQNFNQIKEKRLDKGKKILHTMFKPNNQTNVQQQQSQTSLKKQLREAQIIKQKGQTIAIVTFKYSNTKDLISQYNSTNIFKSIRQTLFICCPEDKKFTLDRQKNMKKIKIQKAPEPQDIKWQNLSATKKQKIIRKAATYLITLFLLSISFTIVYLLSVIQTRNELNFYVSIAISFTISAVNFIIGFFIRYLTIFQKDYTQTGYQTSLAIKSIWAQLLNTIVIPIIIHYIIQSKNIYGRNGLSTDVIYLSITNSFLPPLTKLIDPYFRYISARASYYRNSLKQKLLMKQVQFNEKQELMAFETGYQYIYFISLYLFSAYFATLQPCISIISIVGMFLMYWIQKYSLLNRVKRPVPGTDLINSTMSQMISLGPLFFAIGALNWSHILEVQKVKQSTISHYVPNLVAAGLASLFLIFPLNLIFDKYLPQFILENLEYGQCRVALNSEYDRTNPATMQAAFQQYYDFLKKYIKTKHYKNFNSQGANSQSLQNQYKFQELLSQKAPLKIQQISQKSQTSSVLQVKKVSNPTQNNCFNQTIKDIAMDKSFIKRKKEVFKNRLKLRSKIGGKNSVQNILGDLIENQDGRDVEPELAKDQNSDNSNSKQVKRQKDYKQIKKTKDKARDKEDKQMVLKQLKKCQSEQFTIEQQQNTNQDKFPLKTPNPNPNPTPTQQANLKIPAMEPTPSQKPISPLTIARQKNTDQQYSSVNDQQTNISFRIKKQNPSQPRKLDLDFKGLFPGYIGKSNQQNFDGGPRDQNYINFFGRSSKIGQHTPYGNRTSKDRNLHNPYDKAFN